MIRTLACRRSCSPPPPPPPRYPAEQFQARSRCRSSTRSPRRATSPYPGTMTLDIDATDTERGHLHASRRRSRSRKAGPMVLLFPKWLPGKHSPTRRARQARRAAHHAPTARRSAWTRDPVDVYAFHIDVPAGREDARHRASSSSRRPRPIRAASSMTPNMMQPAVEFDEPLSGGLFHAPDPGPGDGALSRRLAPPRRRCRRRRTGSTYSYEHDQLRDAGRFAGARRALLQAMAAVARASTSTSSPTTPAELAATPEQIDAHKRLVEQAVKTVRRAALRPL